MKSSIGVAVRTVACALLSCIGWVLPSLAAPAIPYERHVLPNGLTLIVHEDHKAPIVALSVFYRAGSRDEAPGRSGFAHLYEHLMFVGSEHHDDEFFRPMRAAGATDMSGQTHYDLTHYYQNVPSGALDLALWLESDRMTHFLPAVSQKDLDAQRGVVKNENRQYANLPYGRDDDVIAANTYPPEHPYSRTVGGSEEDLNAATLEDVEHWFRTYNGAANAIVVIAGDITAAQALEKVERYFADAPAGPLPARRKSWVAKMSGEQRLVSFDAVSQPRLYKVWNVPGCATRDYALLEVAADILAGGKTSRLHQRLLQTDGVATDVTVNVRAKELGSQFNVTVTLKSGADLRAAEQALSEEMSRFLRDGPTVDEMKRARSVADAQFVRRLERINAISDGGKSWILGASELFGGSPDFYQQSLDWVRQATPNDVRSVMQDWLSDGSFVLEVQPTPQFRVAASSVDRSSMPEPGAPSELHLPSLQRMTLSNGLNVVLAERHGAPLVNLSLILDAGRAADSAANAGTAALTLDMLDEGAGKRDGLQIAARANELGAKLSMSAAFDASFVEFDAMADRLDDSLALLGDFLIRPTFPQTALERVRQQQLADIEQERSDPKGIAQRLLPGLMYGAGHAYASPLSGKGSAAAIGALTRKDVETFHRRWIRPDNATLLIVGDTTREAVAALLERHLGAWRAPSESLPKKNLGTPVPSKARVWLVDRPGAEQSMIVTGNATPSFKQQESISAGIVNALLGGLFISRINMNLREDKHWAYVVKSQLLEARGPGAFLVEAPVQADKTADAMREILQELRDVTGSRPPTQSELNSARNSLALALPGLNETTAGVAASYRSLLVQGLPDSHWNDYFNKASELTPLQLATVAKQLVRPTELSWVVVGDLRKIEADIRKLGIGPVSVVDADGKVLR